MEVCTNSSIRSLKIISELKMKLKCTHCAHIWNTRKDKVPSSCPHCKYSTYYYKPITLGK